MDEINGFRRRRPAESNRIIGIALEDAEPTQIIPIHLNSDAIVNVVADESIPRGNFVANSPDGRILSVSPNQVEFEIHNPYISDEVFRRLYQNDPYESPTWNVDHLRSSGKVKMFLIRKGLSEIPFDVCALQEGLERLYGKIPDGISIGIASMGVGIKINDDNQEHNSWVKQIPRIKRVDYLHELREPLIVGEIKSRLNVTLGD